MFTILHRDRGGDIFYRAHQVHYTIGRLHGLAGPEEGSPGLFVGCLNSGEAFIMNEGGKTVGHYHLGAPTPAGENPAPSSR